MAGQKSLLIQIRAENYGKAPCSAGRPNEFRWQRERVRRTPSSLPTTTSTLSLWPNCSWPRSAEGGYEFVAVQTAVDASGSESWVPLVTTIAILLVAFAVLAIGWKVIRLTIFRNIWTTLASVAVGGGLVLVMGWIDPAEVQAWMAGERAEDAVQFWGPVALPLIFVALLFGLLIFARLLRGVLRHTLFRNRWTSAATVIGFVAAMAIGGAVRNVAGLIFTLSIFDLVFDLLDDDSGPPAPGPGDFGQTPGSRYWRERAEQQAGRPLPDGDYGPGSGWA